MTAPVGAFSRAMYNLQVTLADCTVFRTWVGAANRAAALARIYIGDPPPPADNDDARTRTEWEAIRPFAVIDIPQSGIAYKKSGINAGAAMSVTGGVLTLLLEQTVAVGDVTNPSEAWLKFWNVVGRICRRDVGDAGTVYGLLDLAATTEEYLPISGITPVYQYRAEENEVVAQGDHIGCILHIDYGFR